MSSNLVWHTHKVTRAERAAIKHQKPCLLWFTGLSGSGKSTIANALDVALYERGYHTFLMDGDNVRHGLNKDLGFSDEDRIENIRRVGEFIEVFMDTPLSTCEERDPKGLYKKARAGQIRDFTGIDSPYEVPERPEVRLDTSEMSVEACIEQLIGYLHYLIRFPYLAF